MNPSKHDVLLAKNLLDAATEAQTVTNRDAPRHKEWDIPVGRIGLYRSAIRRLEAAIEYEIGVARAEGISWDAIAYDLGTTRQGAWQRYGGRTLGDAPPLD